MLIIYLLLYIYNSFVIICYVAVLSASGSINFKLLSWTELVYVRVFSYFRCAYFLIKLWTNVITSISSFHSFHRKFTLRDLCKCSRCKCNCFLSKFLQQVALNIHHAQTHKTFVALCTSCENGFAFTSISSMSFTLFVFVHDECFYLLQCLTFLPLCNSTLHKLFIIVSLRRCITIS